MMGDKHKLYKWITSGKPSVPILLHLPHTGTYIPPEILKDLDPEMAEKVDETDFFLDQLYGFVNDLGIDILMATHSRWVVDLNRNPEGQSLYKDGRVITDVVPLTNFDGKPLYTKSGPDAEERKNRLASYYFPYYSYLQEQIEERISKHGKLLLWDGHSIRRNVPGIQKDDFPDLILGSAGGESSPEALCNQVLTKLRNSDLEVTYNHPFQGGHITRSLHKRSRNLFTLQLEMSKDLYMKDNETRFDTERAEKITILLERTFRSIISSL